MVLCLVDDLIFSVKISTAAKALGVPVLFERSADMALARVTEKSPSLVVIDLNSQKLRPLDIIAQMKSDPALKAVKILGYVSHVQTNVIAAARAAGIDEVMARSAFSERLGEILSSSSTAPADQDPEE